MKLPEKELKEAAGKIKEEIEKNAHATVIVHHNADPDAIGSAVAIARGMAQLGAKCTVLAPADISRQSMAILSKYPYPVERKAKLQKLVFLVDSSSKEQVPVGIPESSTVILIDHHEKGALAGRADVALVDTGAHSTAEIALSLLKEAGAELTKEMRFFLLAGIVADTAFLRNASIEDLKRVVELSQGIELEEVFSAISVTEDISERIAKLQATKRLEAYRVGNIIAAFSSVGSFESHSARSIMKSGADIAVVFNVQKKEIRVSGRMRSSVPEKIDLAKAFMSLGEIIMGNGGGHRTAASANGADTKSRPAAIHALLSYFEKSLGNRAKKIL